MGVRAAIHGQVDIIVVAFHSGQLHDVVSYSMVFGYWRTTSNLAVVDFAIHIV